MYRQGTLQFHRSLAESDNLSPPYANRNSEFGNRHSLDPAAFGLPQRDERSVSRPASVPQNVTSSCVPPDGTTPDRPATRTTGEPPDGHD